MRTAAPEVEQTEGGDDTETETEIETDTETETETETDKIGE